MRSLVLASLLAATAAGLNAAETPVAATAAAKSPADADLDAVWAIYREENRDPDLRKKDPRAWFKAQDERMQRLTAAARAYAAKYPTNPERYNPLIQCSYTRPYFVTGFKPEFDTAPNDRNLEVDTPALLEFYAAQRATLSEIIEAPEASLRQRGGAMNALLVDSGAEARVRGAIFDVESVGPLVDRVLAKVDNETILPVIDLYQQALGRAGRAEALAAFATKLKSYPKVAALVAEQDAKRAAEAAVRAQKLTALANLKFTAVDGREVEVAQLKGKVVLIDFWATWCGPCIAELPNVKKVYSAYHDKGFEVIGITLENSNLRPNDTAEQTAAKLAAAKRKLEEFTAKNEMPWPQYFDGQHWKNPYRDQFGIDGIPAMFLLDRGGKLVSTEARGPKLEAEVKRLLGL